MPEHYVTEFYSTESKRKHNALYFLNFILFYQAEDGKRVCLLSRGLGDVYKRQDYWGI